ncbi:MAG: hypothetical protein A3F10_07495 [Coxiella sp. RIFCSPHIGHO2_12_FULL_42_15]|nr:MAG: hypothetical protein A3F10_07495 [Coxiella sp. RIFCSPHIGHO2_12_FULL_42_15]
MILIAFFIFSSCYLIFVSPGIDRYRIIRKETKYLRDRRHSTPKNKILTNAYSSFELPEFIQTEIFKKHLILSNLIIHDNNKFIVAFMATYFSVVNFLVHLNQAKTVYCDSIQIKKSDAPRLIQVELQCLLK